MLEFLHQTGQRDLLGKYSFCNAFQISDGSVKSLQRKAQLVTWKVSCRWRSCSPRGASGCGLRLVRECRDLRDCPRNPYHKTMTKFFNLDNRQFKHWELNFVIIDRVSFLNHTHLKRCNVVWEVLVFVQSSFLQWRLTCLPSSTWPIRTREPELCYGQTLPILDVRFRKILGLQ